MDCENSLNKILVDLNDSKVTRPIMSRYHRFKSGLKQIVDSNIETKLKSRLIDLWKKDQIESASNISVPKDAKTHLLCCMTAYYRIAKRDIS